MTTPPASCRPTIPRTKRVAFGLLSLVVGTLAAALVAEVVLRYRQDVIARSDRMDPGLFAYDSALGWSLTPGWQGEHSHHDFSARYTINRSGFRGVLSTADVEGQTYAIVGDSFAFGLGVDDPDVFTSRLGTIRRRDAFLNFAVPGYSTDQEYLLTVRDVLPTSPDHLVLIVYLANDLFDNERPFPLQADNAKPFFALTPDGLELRNTPVPRVRKSATDAREDLRTAVFGAERAAGTFPLSIMAGSRLLQALGLVVAEGPSTDMLADRLGQPVRLFWAITGELSRACKQEGAGLSLVLMPGSSFIDRPSSPSAALQDYLRKRLHREAREREIHVIDLAGMLRETAQTQRGPLFFPNEGHLTPVGHEAVAGILANELP